MNNNVLLFEGHRRIEVHDHHHHHKDIPILAIPNNTISSSFQKITPYGKSVTIKTEDFPLTKPINHDTNLTDAQLIITRDADGRHHIGQITYKSEEDLTQSHTCPHHHHPQKSSSPVATKIKSARGTGRITSSSMYNKQSSPSTDQDYSSYTPSSSIDTRSYKTEPISSKIKTSRFDFSEGFIDNIDGYITPVFGESENDFDISDIGEALQQTHQDEDITNMDEDSLESCEGILDNKKKFIPSPIISEKKSNITKIKSGGVCTALYLAQKQKQASMNKTTLYSRSNTLPNVIEAMKKEEEDEEEIRKTKRKSSIISQRSQSIELFDKSPLTDISKLDRDSGFDEQDFRCERLHSSYDDNSSLSSLPSRRSSIGRSLSSDLNGHIYRENKAYELRLKALDSTRNLNEQQSTRRNLNSFSTTRPNETIVHKYRKNQQQNFYLKH